MGVKIQEIFTQYYSEFEATHPLPYYVRKAAHKIIACRTAALGGHVQECPEGIKVIARLQEYAGRYLKPHGFTYCGK